MTMAAAKVRVKLQPEDPEAVHIFQHVGMILVLSADSVTARVLTPSGALEDLDDYVYGNDFQDHIQQTYPGHTVTGHDVTSVAAVSRETAPVGQPSPIGYIPSSVSTMSQTSDLDES